MNTSATLPATAGTLAIVGGTWSWTSTSNILTENASSALSAMGTPGDVPVRDHSVKLVSSAGAVTGNDKADGSTNWSDTLANASYGSSTDRWGAALTQAEVNSIGFGLAFAAKQNTAGTYSDYVRASNFGFAIPVGCYIDGVVATVKKARVYASRTGAVSAAVDVVKLRVYYHHPHYPRTIVSASAVAGAVTALSALLPGLRG